MHVPAPRAAPDTPDLLIWTQRQADDPPPVQTARALARDAAQNEYRRLLYVAMTRAAERLVVCGYEGLRARPKECWYDLVRDALWEQSIEEPADHGEGTVRRFRKEAEIAVQHVAAQSADRDEIAALHVAQQGGEFTKEFPDWLTRNAPAIEAASALIPSAAYRPPPLRLPRERREVAEQAAKLALARGRLVHRLLQALPGIPPERREAAARRYLERNAADFAPDEREALIAQVLGVLSVPRFAALFAPGSRGEVPIVGRVTQDGKRPRIVNGQVDRLAVTPEAVLIADYKTDSPAPRTVPPGYVAQLALYRAVLAKLYPGRSVRAAVLWTEVPDLVELSPEDLDRAFAAVTTP
jgi:ATP-dependent helicase/nuclease subunit A